MSDSLIAFQPAMEEPSNIVPLVRKSSSTIDRSNVTCCHLPRGSVKRTSTNLTSLVLIIERMLCGLCAMVFGLPLQEVELAQRLYGVRAGLAGADADGFLDIEDEYLAVADASRARSLLDGVDGGFEAAVFDHDLDF